jgi:O-antigen/teichoic acid export membrane protein
MDTVPASGAPERNPRKPPPESYFATDHIKADVERRTVRGGAVTVGYQVAKQALGIAEVAILSRLILPADSGLINMVVIVTGFIALFNDLGLSAATVQRDKLDHRQVSTLFWINIAMGVLLGVITAATAPVLAWFYDEPRLLAVTVAIAFGFVFGGMTVQHRALLKRQMRFSTLVRIDLVGTLIGMACAIGAAALLPKDQRYWALVLELLIQGPIQIVGLWLACRWRPSLPVRGSGVMPMLKFGGNLTGFRIINYFARNLDNLLIGKFFGPAALGLYAKAYGLLLLPLRRITEPFSTVTMPALSRLNDSPERFREFYLRMASLVCLLSMPLVALMIGASDWIIGVVLAPEWAGVSVLFALLGVAGLLEPISSTTGWLFVADGRTGEQFRWGFISTGLTVAAIMVGMFWGPVGVAASYGISGLLIRTPLLFWYVGRGGHVRAADLYRCTAPFAITAIAILLALGAFRLWGATGSSLLNLVIAIPLAGIVALATLAALPSGRATLRHVRELPKMLAGGSGGRTP